jgi:hypothetical protein
LGNNILKIISSVPGVDVMMIAANKKAFCTMHVCVCTYVPWPVLRIFVDLHISDRQNFDLQITNIKMYKTLLINVPKLYLIHHLFLHWQSPNNSGGLSDGVSDRKEC